jgi:hypothetical protein
LIGACRFHYKKGREQLYGFDAELLKVLEKSVPSKVEETEITFQACPKQKKRSKTSDIEHILGVLRDAPVFSVPFTFWTFLCHIFPIELYEEMIKYPLPLTILNEVKNNEPCYYEYSCPKNGTVLSVDGCLKNFDLKNLEGLGEHEQFLKFPNSKEIYNTWQKVNTLLTSTRIRELLWKKLKVLEAYEGGVRVRVFRQIPLNNGLPHTDAPNTLASFFFNIPDSLNEVFEFGTRLLSPNIGKNLSYTHQIRFLPNSAYAFRSVPAGVEKSYKPKLFLKEMYFMEGRGTKSAYIRENVTFPSWHDAPYSNCTNRWRTTIFVTYPCLGSCRKKWRPYGT